MKNKIRLIITCILLVIVGSTIIVINTKKKTATKEEIVTSMYPLISNQIAINERLGNIEKSTKYTFDNAYVELNPYKISPLSAIIMFNTKHDEAVEIYINDKFYTKTNSTSKHVIPIYGLYEDYNNIVKLVMNNEEKLYTIKTDKSNIEYPVNVEISNELLNDEIYFTAGSMVSGLTGWDKEGKLRFYLTHVLKMDVEWLENGHFLIGTPQGNDLDGYAATDRYLSFVEMDYMGKIYNYYTMPNSYDFEQQILSDGTLMIGGGNNSIYYNKQLVYIYDLINNKKISEFNLTDTILNIDPEFDLTKLGISAGKNGFYYDEITGELLVSFRQLNSLIDFNYKTKELNWVLTNPNNKYFQNNVWKQYLIDSDFYPEGQHSP